MKNDNRREFLKKSIIGVSGAALIPGSMHGTFSGSFNEKPVPELPVRTLGKTGIKTPLISLGTADATEASFIRAAYESGIKLFFSATYYGEGNNEKLVGEGLKGLPRDSFVIGTAVPPENMDFRTGKFSKAFEPDVYVKKAEESLKRFGLDYVDFLLFPYAGKKETVQNEGVLKALQQLKKQGKTRFVGIASHSDTEEALNSARESGIYDVAMIGYNYKIKDKDSLHSAISEAVKAGMGIVAMKAMSGGEENKSNPPVNSNAVLKWVLQNENIASIVSAMSSYDEMKKNLSMIQNLKMSEQELKDLQLAALPSETGLYCQQCKECLSQCAYNLDIPTIMRSYMYAYGYRNNLQAWHTIAQAGMQGTPCENCGSCSVKCSSGFNVRKKVLEIARIRDIPEEFIHA